MWSVHPPDTDEVSLFSVSILLGSSLFIRKLQPNVLQALFVKELG